MRILMISDVYFPRINGVSTSIKTFRDELEKLGHEVYLIVPDYDGIAEQNHKVFRIASRKIVLDPEDRMMSYKKVVSKAGDLRRLHFDLIHVQTPFIAHYAGLRLARELAIPCVATYHTLFEEYFYHYIPWLPKQLLRLIARRFSCGQCNQLDGIISPSPIIANLLKQYGVEQRIVTIPTGIDTASFTNGNGNGFRKKLGIDPSKKLLLNVSRVAFEKNIGLLIDVFARLRKDRDDIHLVIAGEGPAREHYKNQVSSLKLSESVSFVGYLNRETELVSCYDAANIFIFASKTETQGLVLLEAMAAGTPVVSVAEMGTTSVLIENKGARITDGSIDDFCKKIEILLNNEDDYLSLSQSAVDYANEWSSSNLAEKMAHYYQDIRNNQTDSSQSSLQYP